MNNIIPEVEIYNIIKSILVILENDLRDNTDNHTILFKIFQDLKIEKYSFFQQSKDIFSRNEGNQRKIEVRNMFDAERAHLPTIHISMPSESHGQDGIGVDEGYIENISEDGNLIKFYTRSFETQYNCIITSDNSLEVLTIYVALKCLILSIIDSIELGGVRNLKVSGQDLQINSEFVPPHIFSRGITLSFFYEQSMPNFQKENFISQFFAVYSNI